MRHQNLHSSNLKIYELIHSKREEMITIANKHGAFNLRIFGSVARGEADENSDIDILVDYSLDKISSWFPAGLILDLEQLLGYKVDIVTESGLKERIREQVLKEAKPL